MLKQSHRIYCPYLSLRVLACIVLGLAVVKTKVTLVPDPYSTPVLLERSGKASPCFWARHIEALTVQVQVGKLSQCWKCCQWELDGLSSHSSCFPCQVPGSLLGGHWDVHVALGPSYCQDSEQRNRSHGSAPGYVSSAPCSSHIKDTGIQNCSSTSGLLFLSCHIWACIYLT